MPQLLARRVLEFPLTDSRLASNGVPRALQRLRCRVNYQALRYTPAIQAVAHSLVARLRSKGPFYVALHLRWGDCSRGTADQGHTGGTPGGCCLTGTQAGCASLQALDAHPSSARLSELTPHLKSGRFLLIKVEGDWPKHRCEKDTLAFTGCNRGQSPPWDHLCAVHLPVLDLHLWAVWFGFPGTGVMLILSCGMLFLCSMAQV